MSRFSVLILVLAASLAVGDDDQERAAYLKRRADEKAAAEQAVAELTVRDHLTEDDYIRLSKAYNELGDNPRALEAVCQVADTVLAEKKELDLKAICFQNVTFSDDKSVRTRELAFIDRCLDRKYGSEGIWLWRKAKVICQSSSVPETTTVGDNLGSPARVVDREQYEYSFELLTKAFEKDPNLYQQAGVGHSFMWGQDFPLLSQEARFQELMKKHSGIVEKK